MIYPPSLLFFRLAKITFSHKANFSWASKGGLFFLAKKANLVQKAAQPANTQHQRGKKENRIIPFILLLLLLMIDILRGLAHYSAFALSAFTKLGSSNNSWNKKFISASPVRKKIKKTKKNTLCRSKILSIIDGFIELTQTTMSMVIVD